MKPILHTSFIDWGPIFRPTVCINELIWNTHMCFAHNCLGVADKIRSLFPVLAIVTQFFSGISENCLSDRRAKSTFAVLRTSSLTDSVKIENYCSVKIRLKALAGCSRFKSALISPSSLIDLKLKVQSCQSHTRLERGWNWYLCPGGWDTHMGIVRTCSSAV